MILSTEAIVLGSIKYAESSIITQVYTLDKGSISIISSCSKGKKSSKNSLLQRPFSLVNITAYLKKGQEIHRLKEVSLHQAYKHSTNHVIKDAIRFFIAEFLNKVIRENENNLALYEYLKNAAIHLEEYYSANYILIFLRDLMPLLGIMPDIDNKGPYFDLVHAELHSNKHHLNNSLNEDETAKLIALLKGDNNFNNKERRTLLNNLIKYFEVQQDQSIHLKTKEVIEMVFD